MRCPFCNHEDDKVVDSRSCREGMAIRRRRECLDCNRRFTTYEYIENVSTHGNQGRWSSRTFRSQQIAGEDPFSLLQDHRTRRPD